MALYFYSSEALSIDPATVYIEGIQVPANVSQLLPLLGLTLCLQVIGHNLLAHCQGKLNINLSSIICLTQPAIASVYSFLVFSEIISVMEILGIVILITGVYLVKLQYGTGGAAAEHTKSRRTLLPRRPTHK